MNKNTIALIIRILVSALFLVSAYAKLYPSPYFAITTFEIKQLLPMGFSQEVASYFSRTLIGIEFALGILILIPNFLKRITIPATILLLLVFVGQLTYEISKNGNDSNCGCFGELIPMTPIEAIIKNIITIALLIGLWKITSAEKMNNFWINSTILFASILGVFMIAPMKNFTSSEVHEAKNDSIIAVPLITPENDSIVQMMDTSGKLPKDSVQKIKEKTVTEPKSKSSGYADLYPDIDRGKKLLCFFAPGCDHCQQTAKELTELAKKNKNFPDVKIVFMDEEVEKIPEFFKFAGREYTYKVLDVGSFWMKLGTDKTTPGVFYLWNGNVLKQSNGINEKAFNKKEFEKAINKKYEEVK